MKEFTVKENDAFRLRVKMWKCVMPSDLNSLEFIQETLNDGAIVSKSTYNFFMTDAEIEILAKQLLTSKEVESIVNA